LLGSRKGLLAALTISLLFEGKAMADGIGGYMDLTYSSVKTSTEDSTGNRSESDTGSLLQRYYLSLDKRLYPNLKLLGSGLFERNASDITSGTEETKTTLTKTKPSVGIYLNTPLYRVEGGWDKTTERVSGATPGTVRETWFGAAGWRPDGYPATKVQYFRTNTYDTMRSSTDATEDTVQLTSEYRPVRPLYFRYTGTYDDQRDRVQSKDVRTTTHEGRITYGDQFLNKRISVNSEYYVNLQGTDVSAAGSDNVQFSLSPLAGYSAVTDTPTDVVLGANPPLVDGNLSAGAGINIGLPAAGTDTRPRNIGLDFGADTPVNTLLVFVDRDLPAEISSAFTWDIYSSSDNKTWVLRQTVPNAAFGPFLTRFEIRFTTVSARYVKAVTRPLSATVVNAVNFPTIQVTELQAQIGKAASEVQGTSSATAQRFNLNSRVRLLESPSLYYELSYYLNTKSPGSTTSDLTNGLSLNHRLGKVFSITARVFREDGKDSDVSRSSNNYSASLAATPLDTLSHTLTVSGKRETVGGTRNDVDSVFFINTAQLYKGVGATVSAGKSVTRSGTGQRSDETTVSAGLSLVPHETVTVNFAYNDRTRKTTGGDNTAETTDLARSAEVSLAWNPFRTLYLFGSYRVEDLTATGRNRIANYSLNWSPFPDGTLRASLNYAETLKTENNEKDRAITPDIRWNISSRSFLDLSWQDLRTDSTLQKTKNQAATVNLHLAF